MRLWRQYDGRSRLALKKHKMHIHTLDLLLACIQAQTLYFNADYLVLDKLFSCEDAAQQVLMYVPLCVCLCVPNLKF